jgi:hypothetical protein
MDDLSRPAHTTLRPFIAVVFSVYACIRSAEWLFLNFFWFKKLEISYIVTVDLPGFV